jgi:hypothetical protein
MKFCYCDESGTGNEPIAVMVGVVVDASRMHLTKDSWNYLLSVLSKLLSRQVKELHTSEFYPGNGIWRGIDGPLRSKIITAILDWLMVRKHDIVYSVIHKERFNQCKEKGQIPDGIRTIWRTLGFHLLLALQKAHQRFEGTKGNTIVIYDSEKREEIAFTDLVTNPPNWSDSYYSRQKKSKPLNQIIDVPYFADSRDVALIQLADFLSFFIRRYVEIKEELTTIRYDGEDARLEEWMGQIMSCSIGSSFLYPKKGRCSCGEIFYSIAPETIKTI